MLKQLESVSVNINEFKKGIGNDVFVNIKFKPSDLLLLETPLEFYYGDAAVTSDYYNLKNKLLEPALVLPKKFAFQSGHNKGNSSKVVSYEQHKKTINLEHNKIQSEIYKQLANKYGKENVGTENYTGNGTRIDLVIKHEKNFTFYEIKTGNSALQCIREAFGQLLEYANFKNDVEIEKFIVVSPNKLDSEIKTI